MVVAHLVVQARVEELGPQRRLADVIVGVGEGPSVAGSARQGDFGDAHLIVIFEIRKPEEFVFLRRPAQGETGLPPRKER